jgi:hypothetical protein
MADNGVAGARTRSSEVVLSPGVRPGVFRGPWRAVLRYAGSCLVFKYQFVASDPSIYLQQVYTYAIESMNHMPLKSMNLPWAL